MDCEVEKDEGNEKMREEREEVTALEITLVPPPDMEPERVRVDREGEVDDVNVNSPREKTQETSTSLIILISLFPDISLGSSSGGGGIVGTGER
jgi:nitrate reductase NapE component